MDATMRYDMERYGSIVLSLLLLAVCFSCRNMCVFDETMHSSDDMDVVADIGDDSSGKTGVLYTEKQEKGMKMRISIGEKEFEATLNDNSSVDALLGLLSSGPISLEMSDYAGMEKCADIGTLLPENNVWMNTEPGDLVLYQGRTFVIYYGENSWSLTPLGKIDDVDPAELREALGRGDVLVTLHAI